MRAPMMSIHTVAAGGGSILHFDGARLRVGPDSAGANPGPACYRRGGPLAVTDCNVMLGKIQPAFFPHVFGPRGDQALDRRRGARAVSRRSPREIRAETGRDLSPEQVAEGFIDIAVGNMAEAIKKISVQRGHDVTRYTLTVFGGAGGQHACRVADALGMTRIFAHPLAGVLSAYGMGLADQTAMREESVERRSRRDAMDALGATLDRLGADAVQDLLVAGRAPDRIRVVRRAHLRYDGTDTALMVPAGDAPDMQRAFETAYRSATRS
jgi:5-oxoprolinase (ATP-hydrolysing)